MFALNLRPIENCSHNTIIVNDVKYLVVQLKSPAAAINIVRNEENILRFSSLTIIADSGRVFFFVN